MLTYDIYLYDMPGLGCWYTWKEVRELIQDGRKLYEDRKCTKIITI